MKYLIILSLFIFSCQEESIRLSPDCYKLDNPEIYLDGLETGNTTIWAVKYSGEEVEIACSWADAYVYMWEYNCNNYPSLFSDLYVALHSNGTPCKSI